MTTVRWLLVGAGDIARKRVAPALANTADSAIAGICEVRAEQAASLAAEFGVAETYTDLADALANTSANAVYLATPVGLHAHQAMQVQEAGKHVIIEKPLGLTGEECTSLLARAAQSKTYAACAYYRRFYPRYLQAKAMLEGGEFGQVISADMHCQSWYAPTPDDPKYWRLIRAKSGGGPLADMGSHMFDLLIGLFGMPVSVFAKCDNLTQPWDVEDSAAILMTMANGAEVMASFQWNSRTWRHDFEIVGTEARLLWSPYDAGPVTKTVGRDKELIEQPNAGNVHQPLVEDFVQAIISGRPPAHSLAESAKSSLLLDAIYRSSAERREIILSETAE